MSARVSPSIFEGESVLEMPEVGPAIDLSKVYAQNNSAPSKENYAAAFEPNELQRSPNARLETVYTNEPILQEVAVPVEVKTFDFKLALLFLGLGYVIFKYFKKKR